MNANETHKTRWSLTAFVLLVALVFSVLAFRHFTSALILMAVVIAVVVAVNVVARRRRS